MSVSQPATKSEFDVARVRADFPILNEFVHDKPLVYLDSGASAQKPRCVIDAVSHYYEHDHANVHRGVHTLSQRATDAYEEARETLRRFINAQSTKEIIYVRGTTEGINLVAQAYARPRLQKGDEIIVSEMEHHSNIVPWQQLAEQTGAVVKVLPFDDDGVLDQAQYATLLNERTAIVAVTHVANALGTVNPIKEMTQKAHGAGAVVVVDGAQAVPHLSVDVQALGCDFYAFSGHKMYGPTGIGVLFGREALLDEMPPWQGGGEMIKTVSFERTVYHDLPYKFEAGTPDISGAIGLGVAAAYLLDLGLDEVAAHEDDVLRYGVSKLGEIEGLRSIGNAPHKAGILSLDLEGIHPHDIGTMLDHEGVAVRTGHHCAQPVMQHYDVAATTRASLGVYNTREDIDRLFDALNKVAKVFRR